MPVFLALFARILRLGLRGWRLSLAIAVVTFGVSWWLMWLVEPATNEITRPGNYWWWFLVTSSTVGYGDFYPETGAGHVVAAAVIVGGIVAFTILFADLASSIQRARSRHMKGTAQLDLEEHLVVLGYTPGRSERILDAIAHDGPHAVVLCAGHEVTEHPAPERPGVHFVRGDLTTVDTLTRACVPRASAVLVDGRDDNETLAMTVVVAHLNPRAHLVAAVFDMARAEHLRYLHPSVQCVQWHMPDMLSDEVLDPGITQVYADLMTSGGRGNTYSVAVPRHLSGKPYGQCQTYFGRGFAATLVAVRQGGQLLVSPAWDHRLTDDALLYYIAGERVDPSRLTVSA